MHDGIINGTGNSRYLKSVADFLTLYPSYEDFAAALIAGTLPVDFNGINQTGWAQLPTVLNKENLLSDATAALFGGGASSTVDDIFENIGSGTPVSRGGTGLETVTAGSFLVGNGEEALVPKTPAEVLSLIGGAKVALLWTNAAPTSEFATQNLTVGAEHEMVIIPQAFTTGSQAHGFCAVVTDVTGNYNTHIAYESDGNTHVYSRAIRYYSSSGVLTIGDCKRDNVLRNDMLIPLRVYGVNMH